MKIIYEIERKYKNWNIWIYELKDKDYNIWDYKLKNENYNIYIIMKWKIKIINIWKLLNEDLKLILEL